MRPSRRRRICDPACGTGGFLLAAHDYIAAPPRARSGRRRSILEIDALRGVGDRRRRRPPLRDEPAPPRHRRTRGRDAVVDGRRRAAEQAIERVRHGADQSALRQEDAASRSSTKRASNRSEALTIDRDDFWATTSNKQLNFVQHVVTMLKHARPRRRRRAGQRALRRRRGRDRPPQLLHECDVHTLLRLPTGIFYAQGVKANVLFFDRKPPARQPWTEKLWIYDLRTNQHFTLKNNPLKRDRPRRLRRLLQPGEPPRAQGDRAVQVLHLRRTDRSATRPTSTSSG